MASEWSQCSLADLIDIKHGFAFAGEFINDERRGDVLLTPGNFAIGGGFKGDKLKYYDGPVPGDFVLKEGDLLVTMTDLSKQGDTLGLPAFVPAASAGRRFLHNQRLGKVLIRDAGLIDVTYLHYLLRTADYRHEVLASATGTAVKHTSPERIRRFAFLRPPLPEQRAIAHILGTLDDKIELNRRMSETLEAMTRVLFRSWFVDFDPVRAKAQGRDPGLPKHLADLFPSRVVDSELGAVPDGWGVSHVDAEFEITMGQSPPGETYNATGAGVPFYQGRADFQSRFPGRRVYCTAPTRFAKKGDTLVSVRAPVGDVNMAAEDCAIGRGVAAARHRSGSRSYTYQVMRGLEEVFATFEAEGTVFGSMSKKDFHGIRCVAPAPRVVGEFERLLAPLDDRVEIAWRDAGTLAALRDTLLPKLMAGELRVKDAEEFVARVAVWPKHGS